MSGPSTSFPAYLQARVSNTYANPNRLAHHHHHHHLRQFHQIPFRTMATNQDSDVFGFGVADVAYGNDNFETSHDNQMYGAGAGMTISRMHTFEEMSRNNPISVSALTNISQWQEMQQASSSFRPLAPMPTETPVPVGSTSHVGFSSTNTNNNMSSGTSFDSTNTSFGGSVSSSYDSVNASFTSTNSLQLPLKIDTSVATALPPPMSILSTVDTTQYEEVPDGHWIMASTDYSSSSRSSAETESLGPRTPLSPHASASTQSSYFSMGYQGSPSVVTKVEGTGSEEFAAAYQRQSYTPCLCDICTVSMPPQLSAQWQTRQHQASFQAPVSGYGYSQNMVSGRGHSFDVVNNTQTVVRPFPTRQTSPPVTSSLVELERQVSEATTEEDSGDSDTESELNVNDQAVNDATHRQKRDSYLLSMRRKNYSYKDIKELGNFREAESTLRGRVRVLTKDRSQRVRKPEWTDNDVRLLRSAYKRFAGLEDDDEDDAPRRPPGRMPWKKVSNWMKNHGGSYPFAPATCARKWKALH